MCKKIFTILLFLSLATPCLANNVFLSPANFMPEESLLGNKTYTFSFYVTSQELVNATAKIECMAVEARERICPPTEWFKIKPRGEFLVDGSQEIEVKLRIPANEPNIDFETMLVVYPQVETIDSPTQILPALGAKILFTKQGKISFVWRAIYWLQSSIGKPLTANINRVENVISPWLLMPLLFCLGIIIFITNRKIRKPKERLVSNSQIIDCSKIKL